MTEPVMPAPITDHDQRLMIATEIGTYRRLVAQRDLTREAMQRLNRELVLPDGPVSPAQAHQDNHRQALLAELQAALVEDTGFPLDYWQQPHRPEVPDDLADLDDDRGGDQ